MFFMRTGVVLTIIACVTASYREYLPISKSCHLGDTAENEWNECVCTSKGHFECFSKPCNETGIENIEESQSCLPNKVYVHNLTVCICKTNGSWPHEKCKTTFKSLPTVKKECQPNSYIIIDCNVCKCGPNGIVDKEHCTKNECKNIEPGKGRRFLKQNQVYGSCEAKNWYSLAPCQFCFCISENKLVCNTGNNYSRKLQLGSYNLSVCGMDLIKDAIGLIPDSTNALRYGGELENKTKASILEYLPNTTDAKSTEYNSHASIELNLENREKKTYEVQENKTSEEYYTDSDEPKAMNIAREGMITQLPPFDEEIDVSDDDKDRFVETEKGPFAFDFQSLKQINIKPSVGKNDSDKFSQHFEWKIGSSEAEPKNLRELSSENFDLGNVLKPFLPVMLDKVFKMALRKSMVSVDAHANCTPGSTTAFKCNTCFCMKNNKLLCTNNTCT